MGNTWVSVNNSRIQLFLVDKLQGIIIGFISGLAVAIGGAIKDAPYEGFDPVKFIRSPAIGTVEGLIIVYVVPKINPYVLFFTVIGTERVTTETYKIIRAKIPGKFLNGEWGIPKPIMSR